MTVRPYFFRDDLSEDARVVITTAMETMMSKDAPFRTGILIFQKALIRVCERHWLSADTGKPPTADELCRVIADSPYLELLNGGGNSEERMAAMREAQAEEYGDNGPGLIAGLFSTMAEKSDAEPGKNRDVHKQGRPSVQSITMTASLEEIEENGSEPREGELIAARNQTLRAIRALIESDPEGWPEHLAALAGTACDLNCSSLDLLADASVQVAAKAHKRRHEQNG